MFHKNLSKFFVIGEQAAQYDWQWFVNTVAHLVQLVLGRSSMQSFTHPVGDSHLYQLAVLKQDGVTPGATASPVVYSVDNPAIATVTPNPAVANNLQCTIAYLTAGTATITATGVNEQSNPFSTQFQAIVTPVSPDLSASFVVTEIS